MTKQVAVGVIALVPDAWQDVVMARHQVLRRLAQHFPLIWIEPPPHWRDCLSPSSARFMAPDRWCQPAPQLDVLSPGFRHPNFHRPSWLAEVCLRSRLSVARRRLVARGATRIALYIWRDEFADALDLVDHDFSCYHVDDEYTFSDLEKPNSPREIALLERVDQVIVHSKALYEKKGKFNAHTALIPNGVDFARFSEPAPEPADISTIPHPRIGYAGVVKKQLDLELMARLARARPSFSFVLVGPIMNVSGKEREIAELRKLPNVHWLGGKPATALPSYVQHFDVCIQCYEINDYTRYIYPLKLNEYLATGRPTISSPIDAVKGLDVVTIARSEREWLAAVDQALSDAASTSAAIEARRAFARANDWDGLVDQIANLFRNGSARLHASPMVEPVAAKGSWTRSSTMSPSALTGDSLNE
jgi:glycosyltransferase involved in cell wall biosynthesis